MNKLSIGPTALIKTTINALIKNPIIFFPFFCLGCIQVFIIELIFFIPRFPLNILFAPIVSKTAGSVYLLYPYNYILLNKWYHGLESWIYIFVSCIFYAAAVKAIYQVNNEQEVDYKKIFKQTKTFYFHLAVTLGLMALVLHGIVIIYVLLLKRAWAIHSIHGIFYWIKLIIIIGAPFFELIFASVVNTLFAFVIPIIMIEEKKIIPAVIENFKNYWALMATIFVVIFVTELPFLLFVILRSSHLDDWLALNSPELSGIFLLVSVLVMLLIDAFQYTAITLCFLFKSEKV